MGIKGLWQALREYVDDGHLSQFRGQRVAVDMYVWLHRCVHRCVGINTEAVLAYLDAKYGDTGSDSANLLGPSAPPPLVMKGYSDSATAVPSTSAATHTCDIPLPSIDDVLALDSQFIALVLDKVAALQRFGVTPVCVFDGDEMPMKGNTNEERQRRRQDAFTEAMLRLEQLYCDERRRLETTRTAGNERARSTAEQPLKQRSRVMLPHSSRLYEEAVLLLEKAVDISTELAHAVIQVLKEERNVECIVAPYEADAQLAYLCREGYVAAAASEDSDLIAYYCPCVISKLDTFSGKCEVLQPAVCAPQFFRSVAATATLPGSSHISGTARPLNGGGGGSHRSGVHTRMRAAAAQPLYHSPQSPYGNSLDRSSEDSVRGAAATAFTYESFLLGCIMSGCDYVANLRNVGIKKAFKIVAHATSLRQVFTILETEYGFPTEELARYRRRLLEAFYCFAHHLVYCPLRQAIFPLHPLPAPPSSGPEGSVAALLKTELVGERWAKDVAQNVCARCLCDPCTLRLYRGTYQSCVTRYLQRARRGQTSLKAYAGFGELSSNRVVVHLGSSRHTLAGEKHARSEGNTGSHDDFGPPLKKVHVASGLLGAGGRSGGSSDGGPGEVVVVRSRYFLMRGRTAVCEQWSASEEESEEVEGGDGSHNCAEERRCVANASGAQDMFSLHTAPPRNAHDTIQKDLGVSQSPGHAASPPSSSSPTTRTENCLAEDSTSDAEPVTRAHWVMGSAHARGRGMHVKVEGSRGTPEGGEGCAAASTRNGGSESRRSTPTLRVADSTGGTHHSDEAGGDSDEINNMENRSDDNLAASRSADQTEACLAESPDVEPYVYSIGGGAPTSEALPEELKTNASAPQCACPFGYWQCNRAHSVFESCFRGKPWCRDGGPPPSPTPSLASPAAPASPESTGAKATAPAPSLDAMCGPHVSAPASPGSNTGGSVAIGAAPQGYIPHAFRPPRSTAVPLASTDASLAARTNTDTTVSAACTSSSTSPASSAFEGDDSSPRRNSEVSVAVLHPRGMTRESPGAVEACNASRNAVASSALSSPLLLPPSSHGAPRKVSVFDKMKFKKST
ncbi:hypothetical protein ABL78_5632 [Leptomonas seymouri]|uniref:Exonuclease 1 n=1 Tax=Leptomonas seymouri TaxID=5684 RepID=A0A0N1PCG6_LEPSE|nr:hypothetical protein ABL78_5632 [Leptomonas seymouri]|eukprot:KPI85320.1 hypothetical protein ABL78_5632 [Leptomonas seymouri]